MLLNGLSEENKKYFLNLELCLASSDDEFHDAEKKLIENHCREMGIDSNNYVIDLPYEEVIKKIKYSYTNKEKKIIFLELLAVALADEVYTEEERRFIKGIQSELQIPDEVAEQAESIMTHLISYSKALEDYVEW